MKQHSLLSGQKIGAIIDEKGLRRDWVASRSGISKSHLTMIIKGQRGASDAVLERIASVLQVPLFLLCESPQVDELSPMSNLDQENAA